MSWIVITRDEINLDEYNEMPFGRFNEALPFLVSFLSSDDSESDFVSLDASNRGKLERVIIKHSGIKLEMRTEKKDGTKLDKPVPITDKAALNRALDSLGIKLVRHAHKANGDEVMSVERLAA